MNLNGVEYYYIRNAQGDIIGLFDKTGAQVVSYTYDTWGKLISTTGSLASTVGVKNPYLYKGYRYDNETGLYYLQSRYYSPEWGRFVNADAIAGKVGELLGANVFAYCKNNAVNKYDSSGFMALDCEGRGRTAPSLVYEDKKAYANTLPGPLGGMARSKLQPNYYVGAQVQKNTKVRALGFSLSAGLGIRMGINVQFVFDNKGHKALAVTPIFGGSTPGSSAAVTYSRYKNTKSLYNIKGWGGDAGFSAPGYFGSGGIDYLFGAHNGVYGISGNYGIKGSPEIHTDVGYTFFWLHN